MRLKRLLQACTWCALAGGAWLAPAPTALADEAYPERSIRLVVPFSPGGGADSLARPLADRLSKALGQTVVVENKSGAGSNIGSALVAKATPDGYTLLINTDAIALYPHLYSNLQYDVQADLTPVSFVASSPLVLGVNKSIGTENLAEFVALVKKQPGELFFANPGVGSPHHLAFELFAREAGIDVGQANYSGGAPSLVDVLGGHVQIGMFTFGAVNSYIEKGDLKALAVLTEQRSTLAPGIPTVVESGFPDVYVALRFVVMAPEGTPDDVVLKLNESIEKVVHEKDFVELLRRQGYEPFTTTPQQTEALLRTEGERWKPILKSLDLKLG